MSASARRVRPVRLISTGVLGRGLSWARRCDHHGFAVHEEAVLPDVLDGNA